MRDIEFYESVPDGSTLEVSFGPEESPATGHVLFITTGDVADQDWSDVELRPGPKTQLLEKDRAYMLEMRVAFQEDTTNTITAKVRKEDGSIYSEPKVWSIDGTEGETALRVLIIKMAA